MKVGFFVMGNDRMEVLFLLTCGRLKMDVFCYDFSQVGIYIHIYISCGVVTGSSLS